jgi:hypothetical protein
MTDGPSPFNPVNYPHALSAPPRRPRRGRFLLAGLCLVVVVVSAVVALTGGKSSSAAAALRVRDALSDTLASRSMTYTMTETVSAGSTTVSADGSGQCDLTNALCDLTINYNGALSSLGSVSAVFSRSVIYLKFGPTISDLLPTPWISMSLSNSESASLGIAGNPLTGLSYLAQQGAVVTDEGVVTLNGQSVTQYNVSIGSSVAQHIVSSRLKDLPSWMAQFVSQATLGTTTETVDVDSLGRLAFVSTAANETVASTTVAATVSETVTGYGVPVNVSVPPASEVSSSANLTKLAGL